MTKFLKKLNFIPGILLIIIFIVPARIAENITRALFGLINNIFIYFDWLGVSGGYIGMFYEKLVIENNNIKNRLVIYKDQIVAHESNQLDLSLSINQLNKTLSKSNTVTNISSSKPFSEENVSNKKKD